MTLGGVLTENPEPGGRAELFMEFRAHLPDEGANLDASWTFSRALNGAIFRIRLLPSVQLVSAEALGGVSPGAGNPWSNDQAWSNDQLWAWDPTSPAGAALAGETTVTVDLSARGQVLRVGHVVGFREEGVDTAHIVLDIVYEGDNVAAVTIAPPLRRDLGADSEMHFRPRMLAQCRNASDLMGQFRLRRSAVINPARFVEALV